MCPTLQGPPTRTEDNMTRIGTHQHATKATRHRPTRGNTCQGQHAPTRWPSNTLAWQHASTGTNTHQHAPTWSIACKAHSHVKLSSHINAILIRTYVCRVVFIMIHYIQIYTYMDVLRLFWHKCANP